MLGDKVIKNILGTRPIMDYTSKNKNKKQLYNRFIEGLANEEDEHGNKIGLKKAKQMYSFEEYLTSGAYDDDSADLQEGRLR